MHGRLGKFWAFFPLPGIRDICLHFLDMASVFYREVMSELQKKLNFTVPDLLDSSRMHSSEVRCCVGCSPGVPNPLCTPVCHKWSHVWSM